MLIRDLYSEWILFLTLKQTKIREIKIYLIKKKNNIFYFLPIKYQYKKLLIQIKLICVNNFFIVIRE